jgi:hypothetical protein
MFTVILFAGGALFVVAYSLWEARYVSNLTVRQAAGVGTAAVIVLVVVVFFLLRNVH